MSNANREIIALVSAQRVIMKKSKSPSARQEAKSGSSSAIAAALADWFNAHGRDYPWRRTTDPYAILVSEMMLQQTQISTVLDRGYYQRWMERFPTLQSLADADETSVLRTWEGLGYYRRSRFLHQLAKVTVAEHGGLFPQDRETVRALPGIGAYTCGAVLSFAFNQPEPIVDGNIARVLSRLFNEPTPVDSTAGQKLLWERAKVLLSRAESPRCHNSAIMELGQTICRTGQPDCLRCPVKRWCLATEPAKLPVKDKKTVLTDVTERVYFHHARKGVLLQQETGKRRTGLWKLPTLPDALPELPPVLHRCSYGITRYKVTLWVHDFDGKPQHENSRFVPLSELKDLPMPSPYRRALTAVLALSDFHLAN